MFVLINEQFISCGVPQSLSPCGDTRPNPWNLKQEGFIFTHVFVSEVGQLSGRKAQQKGLVEKSCSCHGVQEAGVAGGAFQATPQGLTSHRLLPHRNSAAAPAPIQSLSIHKRPFESYLNYNMELVSVSQYMETELKTYFPNLYYHRKEAMDLGRPRRRWASQPLGKTGQVWLVLY